jgi:hypothetical protein
LPITACTWALSPDRGDLGVVDKIVSRDIVTHNSIILDAPSGPDSIRGGIE